MIKTMEDLWVGLRNFLRPVRGIHKKYLHLYVAMFEWAYNLRWIDFDFLRRLLFPPFTYLPAWAKILYRNPTIGEKKFIE